MGTSNKILLIFIAVILIVIGICLFALNKNFSLHSHYYKFKFSTSGNSYSFIEKYKVSEPVNISISTSGGNISVFGCDIIHTDSSLNKMKGEGNNSNGCKGDSLEISFIVEQDGRILSMNLQDLKKIADVYIEHSESKVNIDIKRIYERETSVGFNVKAPAKTSARLVTSGGNISISNITGNQNVNTSGGNIDIDRITGEAQAGTSGGNVSLSASKANINATTSGGNITIGKIDGKLEVSTSGGDIDANSITRGLLANTSGGNIDVKNARGTVDVRTSGGSIMLEGLTGPAIAYTSGGDISADLNQIKDKLELETTGGSITATLPKGLGYDLDLSGEEVSTVLANFQGRTSQNKIKGKMNGGGILIRLTSSGGSVNINYK